MLYRHELPIENLIWCNECGTFVDRAVCLGARISEHVEICKRCLLAALALFEEDQQEVGHE